MRVRRFEPRRFEYGALSPAVAILAVMIFWLAGLVIDGARQLSARSRAISYAQEAARAGASGLDLNQDQVTIDVKDAAERVTEYCATIESYDETVTRCEATQLDTEAIVVAIELRNPTTFLAMLGVQTLVAKGEGEAHAEQGINEGDESIAVPSISMLPTDLTPTVDPHQSASSPTFDPACPSRTVTLTETTTTPVPTPPPPSEPTATLSPTITVTVTTLAPMPPICTPDSTEVP